MEGELGGGTLPLFPFPEGYWNYDSTSVVSTATIPRLNARIVTLDEINR